MSSDHREDAAQNSRDCKVCGGSGFARWSILRDDLGYTPTTSAACFCPLGRWFWRSSGEELQRRLIDLAQWPELIAALMARAFGECGEVATRGREVIRDWRRPTPPAPAPAPAPSSSGDLPPGMYLVGGPACDPKPKARPLGTAIDELEAKYPALREDGTPGEPTPLGIAIARLFIAEHDDLAGIGRAYLREHGIPEADGEPAGAATVPVPAADDESGYF